MFVFLCPTSISMIISRSIHVAANDIILFFYSLKVRNRQEWRAWVFGQPKWTVMSPAPPKLSVFTKRVRITVSQPNAYKIRHWPKVPSKELQIFRKHL